MLGLVYASKLHNNPPPQLELMLVNLLLPSPRSIETDTIPSGFVASCSLVPQMNSVEMGERSREI